MIRVFIGYDSREAIAFSVLAHSIVSRASQPVAITPLMLPQLSGLLRRERHPLQTTEFSFSRFLVPHLCGFAGWAIYLDCDMLVLDDIVRLWELREARYAVQVVKHDHMPVETRKFLNQTQSRYEKKNWSSVMLLNNERCTALTPERVSTASGLELHQFKWLDSDALIGPLPRRWNHLVDYDPPVELSEMSLLHYTRGGPYHAGFETCGYAGAWFAEREAMASPPAAR